MAPPRCSARAGLPLAALVAYAAALVGPVVAQQKPPRVQPPTERVTRTFTTPDGSRFVLVVDASQRQVHWATATWNDGGDDPPGFEGLTQATLLAARGGTWQHGSKDPEAERAALEALDAAWHESMQRPHDQAALARVIERDRAAAALCDARTFPRVLAAAPAHRPELLLRDAIAVHVLTTIEEALPDVAALLVERREQQPLRGLYRAWTEVTLARATARATDHAARLHGEVLALMMPLSPAARMLETPAGIVAPRRADALACWAATQHPSRTVHVLFGELDPDRTEATLRKAFAATHLSQPPAAVVVPPRPLTAERRSVVGGVDQPRLAVAWALPSGADRWTVEAAVRWLAVVPRSQLAQRLARANRPGTNFSARAPWPRTVNGAGLLLLDLDDANGTDGLLEVVLGACADAVDKDIPDGWLFQTNMAMQHDWNLHADDPRLLTAAIAEHALVWPDADIVTGAPPRVGGADVTRLLRQTFAAHPAVVEGHR